MQMGPFQVINIGNLVGQSATCLHGPSSRGCCPLERPAQRAAPLSARPGRLNAQQGLPHLASNPARQHTQLLLLLRVPAARHLRHAQALQCLPAARHLQQLRDRPLLCLSLQVMPIAMHLSMLQSHPSMIYGLGLGHRQYLSQQQTAVPSQPAIRMRAAPSVSSKALYTGPSLLAAHSPAPVSSSSPGRSLLGVQLPCWVMPLRKVQATETQGAVAPAQGSRMLTGQTLSKAWARSTPMLTSARACPFLVQGSSAPPARPAQGR